MQLPSLPDIFSNSNQQSKGNQHPAVVGPFDQRTKLSLHRVVLVHVVNDTGKISTTTTPGNFVESCENVCWLTPVSMFRVLHAVQTSQGILNRFVLDIIGDITGSVCQCVLTRTTDFVSLFFEVVYTLISKTVLEDTKR